MASATASCEDATAALASFNIERMAAHTPALQSFYDFARSKGAAYCLDLLKPLLAVSPFAVDASVGTKISHMRDLLAKHIAPEVTKLAPGSPAEEQIQPAVENFLPGSIEVYRADSELRGIYPTYGSYRAFIAATSGPVVAQRIRLEREANHPRFVDGAWVLGKVGAFETEWLNDPKLQAEFPSAKGYAA